MSQYAEAIQKLLAEADALHARNLSAAEIGPDYYEPGSMEYLDQSDGIYHPESGQLILRYEARGTRYDGRTEQIEKVKLGDPIRVVRDPGNEFNANNFTMLTEKGHNVGHVPAVLCNAMAPLYDAGVLHFEGAKVSFVEPLSKRSRHAKQAMLFVELRARLTETE